MSSESRKYAVCGLGNALVDILVRVDEGLFQSLDLEKGTMRLVEDSEQKALLARLQSKNRSLVSGGSVANSIIACAQLGTPGALLCSVGDDELGRFYMQECEALGVAIPNRLTTGAVTGTCVSIVTPDAERTMRTNLAISSTLPAVEVLKEAIAASEWVFIEGYLLANGEKGIAGVKATLAAAKEAGTKIAFTVSEAWVHAIQPAIVEEIVDSCALVFCNASEACAVTGKADAEEAFEALSTRARGVAMTAGGDGAYVSYAGVRGKVEAFPCTPVDLTGAGDMFAGGFLYGVTHDIPPLVTARKACYLATQVISRTGARIEEGTRQYWDTCPE